MTKSKLKAEYKALQKLVFKLDKELDEAQDILYNSEIAYEKAQDKLCEATQRIDLFRLKHPEFDK